MAPDFKHFDFAKIVDAAGIKAIRVEDPGAFAQPSNRPLRTKGQRSWDVVTSPYELSLPPKITKEQAWGFSLYLLKETLDGNMEEVEDLVAANLD